MSCHETPHVVRNSQHLIDSTLPLCRRSSAVHISLEEISPVFWQISITGSTGANCWGLESCGISLWIGLPDFPPIDRNLYQRSLSILMVVLARPWHIFYSSLTLIDKAWSLIPPLVKPQGWSFWTDDSGTGSCWNLCLHRNLVCCSVVLVWCSTIHCKVVCLLHGYMVELRQGSLFI